MSRVALVEELDEMEPVLFKVTATGYRAAQTEANPFGLTDVQVRTMQMIVNGYSQKQVAQMCNIAPATVKERLLWIRLKMGVDTTLQAAVLWVREVEFGDGTT